MHYHQSELRHVAIDNGMKIAADELLVSVRISLSDGRFWPGACCCESGANLPDPAGASPGVSRPSPEPLLQRLPIKDDAREFTSANIRMPMLDRLPAGETIPSIVWKDK